ncbi:MAG TPA: hypothetical protein GX697_05180 [Firmicutes bacterium]|nr:hypothetical protein [Bacillota bacterium]
MQEDKSPGLTILLKNKLKKYAKNNKHGGRRQHLFFLGVLIFITAVGRLDIRTEAKVPAFITAEIGEFNRENSMSVALMGSLSLLPSPDKSVFSDNGGLGEIFNSADLNILSLDVPLLTAEANADSSKRLLEELAQKDIRLLQISGNGIYQQGLTGVASTLSSLQEHNFHALGAGLNLEEAFSPYHMEKSARKISFLALNGFLPSGCKAGKNRLGTAYFDEEVLSRLISGLTRDGSLVFAVVSFQEGTSFVPAPSERELARRLVDMGAKYVVGTGTGIVRETEQYKDGVIFYGLGDLTPRKCYSFFKEALLLKFFFYADADPEVIAFPLVLKKGGWAVSNGYSRTEKLAAYKIFLRLNGDKAWENAGDYFILKPVETKL